jgi:ABC-type anion transport system duplicated permease subunit
VCSRQPSAALTTRANTLHNPANKPRKPKMPAALPAPVVFPLVVVKVMHFYVYHRLYAARPGSLPEVT